MAGRGPASSARDGGKNPVWKEVDRRRQPRQVESADRHLSGGLRQAHGRDARDGRGRGFWSGRGGRFAGRSFRGTGRMGSREAPESSKGGFVRDREDLEWKRAMDGQLSTDDHGKKRREELCCEICEDDHKPLDCPIFNGPKPNALLCGFAGGDSGFFQIPTCGAKGIFPKKENATAFITVKEGSVTPDLVKAELTRLIPVSWTWSVQPHADGFVVPFPCKVELQRMLAMKFVHTAGGEGIMVIQELDQKIEPVQFLQKTWVNVYGVPYEIRSFLPLWAVGTIFGATQKVDLRYTRKMGVVRLLVGVTNVDSIPESADIVVGEGLYEIFFKVDKVCHDGKWMDYKPQGKKDEDDKEQQEEDFDGLNDHLPSADAAFQDTEMEDGSANKDVTHSSDKGDHPKNNGALLQIQDDNSVLGEFTSSYQLLPDVSSLSLNLKVSGKDVSLLDKQSALGAEADHCVSVLKNMQTGSGSTDNLLSDLQLPSSEVISEESLLDNGQNLSFKHDSKCQSLPSLLGQKCLGSEDLNTVDSGSPVHRPKSLPVTHVSPVGDNAKDPLSSSQPSYAQKDLEDSNLLQSLSEALVQAAKSDTRELLAFHEWKKSKSHNQGPRSELRKSEMTLVTGKRVDTDENILIKA